MTISRRTALAVMTGAPALIGATTVPDIDVAIVGAGACGIMAAHALRAAGFRCLLLDGANRAGGRAWSETRSFGFPYDQGAAWLHSAQTNPWTNITKRYGIATVDHSDAAMLTLGDDNPAATERAAARAEAILERLAAKQVDRLSLAEALPATTMAERQVLTDIALLDAGEEPGRLSAFDVARQAGGADYLVQGGLGNLVVRHSRGLPIRLASPVTAIEMTRAGVRVSGPFGAVTARAAIVTASTGVLATNAIRFQPGLPESHRRAIAGLPMGVLTKIAFACPRQLVGIADGSWVRKADETMEFLVRPMGTAVVIAFVGGTRARNLASLAPAALADAMRAPLREAFGAAAPIGPAVISPWLADPLVRGSYAYALPGQAHQRAALAQPIDERIWIVGEATAGAYANTVGGAANEGVRAARQITAKLRLARR
jgi:monoamine oxidase